MIPEIVRVRERTRKPIAKAREANNWRAYDWASEERSSERAAGAQAPRASWQSRSAQPTRSPTSTLSNASRTYPLHLVWGGGLRWGLNIRILRVVMMVYSAAREVVLEDAYTMGERCIRSSVAGIFAPRLGAFHTR